MLGIERAHELSPHQVLRDSRGSLERLFATLSFPRNHGYMLIALAVISVVLPFLAVPLFLFFLLLSLMLGLVRHYAPLRIPKDLNAVDFSDLSTADGRPKKAGGILFLGHQQPGVTIRGGEETWATDSDSRTHLLLTAATGAGKTEYLKSIAFNALAWGSGFFYSDGKASNDLPTAIYGNTRAVGREDDCLFVNFLTGGKDPFRTDVDLTKRNSNTFNPMLGQAADSVTQMLSSMMAKASGEGAQWQSKAINMVDAVVRVACYDAAIGTIPCVNPSVIRNYMALDSVIKLAERKDLPPMVREPIYQYLSIGLPGFNWEKARAGKLDQTCFDQHGFLTGQFTRTLGLLVETYRDIFNCDYPEVDMLDAVLSNRIVVVCIPTLEKSEEEAANLGKLAVAALRMMMAQNLGSDIEGMHADIIETKMTNAPNPYIAVLEELGGYFVSGISTIFAQARSLGFMMVASSQDLPSMAKGEHKEEVSSVIANTKLKISMALEDPKDTYEIFQKSGGEAFVNQISGYETKIGLLSNSIQQQMTTGIERRDRVSLEELRRLNEGQAVVLFKDRIVRLKAFWAPGLGIKPLTKIPYRVHKFLELRHPTLQDLQGKGESRAKEVDTFGHVMRLMVRGQKPMYLCEPDPVLERLAVISEELMRGGGILQQRIDAVELGIWLFEEVAYAISYGSSSIEEDRLGEGELPGMDYSDDLLDVENMINSLASPQKELAQDTREKLKVAAELMEGTSDAISELEANMMRRRMHYAPPPPPASEPINIDKIAQDINQLVNEKGETN